MAIQCPGRIVELTASIICPCRTQAKCDEDETLNLLEETHLVGRRLVAFENRHYQRSEIDDSGAINPVYPFLFLG